MKFSREEKQRLLMAIKREIVDIKRDRVIANNILKLEDNEFWENIVFEEIED